jgi:hypothetical protein
MPLAPFPTAGALQQGSFVEKVNLSLVTTVPYTLWMTLKVHYWIQNLLAFACKSLRARRHLPVRERRTGADSSSSSTSVSDED